MTRSLAAILCALSISALSLVPACAEEKAAAKDTPPAATTTEKTTTKSVTTESKTTTKETTTKASSGGQGRFHDIMSKLPTNVPAFLAGVVVGTPIAIARMSKREIVTATKDLTGETDNKLLLGAGGVLGVPAGLMSGAIYGVYAGVADSWVNANDNPYSKDSFSLGEMK